MLRTGSKIIAGNIALVLATFVFLTGCTSDHGPWPMPTGYTYHNDKYKAPPGPEPVFKKWKIEHNLADAPGAAAPSMDTHFEDQTIIVDSSAVAASPAPVGNDPRLWQKAADELTGRLLAGFGKPNEAIYIVPSNGSEENLIFAAALRTSLQQQGVTVTQVLGGGPFALHTAIAPVDSNGGRHLLTVALHNGPRKVAEESGLYNVTGAYNAPVMPAPVSDNVPVVLSPSMSGAQ